MRRSRVTLLIRCPTHPHTSPLQVPLPTVEEHKMVNTGLRKRKPSAKPDESPLNPDIPTTVSAVGTFPPPSRTSTLTFSPPIPIPAHQTFNEPSESRLSNTFRSHIVSTGGISGECYPGPASCRGALIFGVVRSMGRNRTEGADGTAGRETKALTYGYG